MGNRVFTDTASWIYFSLRLHRETGIHKIYDMRNVVLIVCVLIMAGQEVVGDADDILGIYERHPVENNWHKVLISAVSERTGVYKWSNDAGVSWTMYHVGKFEGKER